MEVHSLPAVTVNDKARLTTVVRQSSGPVILTLAGFRHDAVISGLLGDDSVPTMLKATEK